MMNLYYDYMKVGQLSVNTWASCMSTVYLRYNMLATKSVLDANVLAECTRMGTEKITVSYEIYKAMEKSLIDLGNGKVDPVKSMRNVLKPIHSKAVSNVVRLSHKNK